MSGVPSFAFVTFGSANDRRFAGWTAFRDSIRTATALGDSVTQAQAAAYTLVDKVDFPGGFCRRDIGWREVEREALAP